MKRKLFFIARFCVSIFLLGLLLWIMRDKLPKIASMAVSINKYAFFGVFLLNFVITFIIAYRMKILLDVQKINISVADSFRYSLIGNFFNNFLPTSVGGDLVKAYLVSKKSQHKKLESFTGVFVDRIFGMITIVLIAAFSLIFLRDKIENRFIFWLVYVLIFLTIFFSALVLNRNFAKGLQKLTNGINFFGIGAKLKRLYNSINIYKDYKMITAKAFFISLFAQMLSIVGIYFLSKAIFSNTPFAIFFLVLPLIITASMLPSLNGLGIREGAFVYFLGPVIGRENSFVLSLLWLGNIILLSLIGAVAYFLQGQIDYRKVGLENDR